MSAVNTDGGLIFTLQLEKSPLPGPIHPILTEQSRSPLFESPLLSFPFSRISRCNYNLVWTAHPALTGERNYILWPSSFPSDSLSQTARNRLNIFIENSRKLLQQHNTGITENSK